MLQLLATRWCICKCNQNLHQIDQIKVLVEIPNELYPPPQCDAKLFFNKNDVIESHFCAWFIFGLFACVWSKKGSHDVGFNVRPYIQEFVYCEQLRGKKIVTIIIIRYDSKTLIPFLCSSY